MCSKIKNLKAEIAKKQKELEYLEKESPVTEWLDQNYDPDFEGNWAAVIIEAWKEAERQTLEKVSLESEKKIRLTGFQNRDGIESLLRHLRLNNRIDVAGRKWNPELYNSEELAKVSFSDGFRACLKEFKLDPELLETK